MRIKLGAFAVALLGVLILIPSAGGWTWRTYGGVYGSHGVSWVAYKEVKRDNGRLPLNWEKIRPASTMPDIWRDEIEGVELHMTWDENRGRYWLRRARDAANAGAWDNVSYFLGVASSYFTVTAWYGEHENIIRYYEYNEPYTDDDNSDDWNESYNERVDHLNWQADYYRPGEPVLIVQPDGSQFPDLSSFLDAISGDQEDGFWDNWIDNVMETDPTNPNPRGWWFDWEKTRKAENRGIQAEAYGDSPPYGSFECVDLATSLSYSGWIYALNDAGRLDINAVDAERISFQEIDPNRGAYFASDDYREDYRFPLYS